MKLLIARVGSGLCAFLGGFSISRKEYAVGVMLLILGLLWLAFSTFLWVKEK